MGDESCQLITYLPFCVSSDVDVLGSETERRSGFFVRTGRSEGHDVTHIGSDGEPGPLKGGRRQGDIHIHTQAYIHSHDTPMNLQHQVHLERLSVLKGPRRSFFFYFLCAHSLTIFFSG